MAYDIGYWRMKDGSGLCWRSAHWVRAKEEWVWRRFSVTSIFGQVAGCCTLLLYLPCMSRVKDKCGTVCKKGNYPKSITRYMVWWLRMWLYKTSAPTRNNTHNSIGEVEKICTEQIEDIYLGQILRICVRRSFWKRNNGGNVVERVCRNDLYVCKFSMR